MNRNIRTLKRVQRIHDKFAALKEAAEAPLPAPGTNLPPPPPELFEPTPEEDPAIYRKWKPSGGPGAEISSNDAWDCSQWASRKILQHEGFTGSSQAALNTLTGVVEEYFSNVGRTLRMYCDNYAQKMSGEEIILHTLFESGVADVSDLEKYITDDLVRRGGRLSDMQRKLENAYRDATTVMAEELGELEEDDEDLTFGNFPEELDGEDFFGFKALGIDKEFGLRSLSVPARLWNAKKRAQLAAQIRSGPTEPQEPFPRPPPFVLVQSAKVIDQIGLLRNFYIDKARAAAPPLPPVPPAPLPAPPPAAPVQPIAPPPAPAPLPPPPHALPQPSPSTSPARPGSTPVPTANGFSLPSSNAIPFNSNSLPSTSAIPFHISAMASSLPPTSAIPSGSAPTPASAIVGPSHPHGAPALSGAGATPYAGTTPVASPVRPAQPPPPAPRPLAPIIPDDAPDAARTKIGPLGQIIVPGLSSSAALAAKRKQEAAAAAAAKPPKEVKPPAPKGRPKKKKDPAPPGQDGAAPQPPVAQQLQQVQMAAGTHGPGQPALPQFPGVMVMSKS